MIIFRFVTPWTPCSLALSTGEWPVFVCSAGLQMLVEGSIHGHLPEIWDSRLKERDMMGDRFSSFGDMDWDAQRVNTAVKCRSYI